MSRRRFVRIGAKLAVRDASVIDAVDLALSGVEGWQNVRSGRGGR
jgi:hypothetical protein